MIPRQMQRRSKTKCPRGIAGEKPCPVRSLKHHPLYGGKNLLLELALNLVALLVGGRLAVESHKRAKVELGRLEELDLADVNLE